VAEPIHVTWTDVAQTFHVGSACQHAELPPLDTLVNPPDEPVVPLGYDPNLRVATGRPRFGLDADGNPIEAPLGGIPFDSEAGTLMSPDKWPQAAAPVDESTAPTRTTTSRTSTSTSSTSA
jgi:hypothetical protein